MLDRRRHSLRRRQPLSGRQVRFVQIPPLPGRAPGVLARTRYRHVRRRPRQFQFPALRSRYVAAARLWRRRQAAQGRELPAVGESQRGRERSRLYVGQSGRHRSSADDGAARLPARLRVAASGCALFRTPRHAGRIRPSWCRTETCRRRKAAGHREFAESLQRTPGRACGLDRDAEGEDRSRLPRQGRCGSRVESFDRRRLGRHCQGGTGAARIV